MIQNQNGKNGDSAVKLKTMELGHFIKNYLVSQLSYLEKGDDNL